MGGPARGWFTTETQIGGEVEATVGDPASGSGDVAGETPWGNGGNGMVVEVLGG